FREQRASAREARVPDSPVSFVTIRLLLCVATLKWSGKQSSCEFRLIRGRQICGDQIPGWSFGWNIRRPRAFDFEWFPAPLPRGIRRLELLQDHLCGIDRHWWNRISIEEVGHGSDRFLLRILLQRGWGNRFSRRLGWVHSRRPSIDLRRRHRAGHKNK